MQLKSRNSLGTVEEFIDGEGTTFHVKKTFDVEPTINAAAELRSNGATKSADGQYWHVGRLDMDVLAMWLKEAGVSWDDTQAAQDVVRRKLLSGDFSKFRVHEGTF